MREILRCEVEAVWKRNAKLILKGQQTLARFTADRALVVRGDRNHVRLSREPDNQYRISLPLRPAHRNGRFEVRVWKPALSRDWYLKSTLDRLIAGQYQLAKASLLFNRGKVFVLLSFHKERPDCTVLDPKREAELVCDELTDDAANFWLRCDNSVLSVADKIYRLAHMKAHFNGIHRRLRMTLGKVRRRQAYRRALVKAGGFEKWAQGPIHELSAHIVQWCISQGAGSLKLSITSLAPDLPWYLLGQQLQYKAEEAGIAFEIDNKSAAAEGRRTEKATRELKKQNLRELRKLSRDVRNVEEEIEHPGGNPR